MYLTLEIVSPQAASMGAEQRKVVGPNGLTIGRLPGNDWVIPDPYISKCHARISYSNGGFFVEGMGRNPIAIGNGGNVIPNNQPRPLRNGDRLFVDQYEMMVTVREGEAPGATPPSRAIDDPFELVEGADLRPSSPPNPPPAMGIPDVWNAPLPGSAADSAQLDPLNNLGGAPLEVEPVLEPINWQQNSPLGDHLDLPKISASAPAAIPDNWDRSGLTHIEQARPAAPPPMPQPRRTARPERPFEPPKRVSTSPARAEPVAPARDRASIPPDLAELLRGAGLADRDISPQVLNELGKVLRVVVQGVMEMLRARSEIKSQFRLPLTRVKAAENNPLKFSPNVESALHTVLVQRNAGYLDTVAAFEDAFADIRGHQMAMLEGMRAGFEAMLESFNPAALATEFERAGNRKSKFWELYTQRFDRLKDDSDTFRRLFGDVFAEAYEQQLERLHSVGRQSGRK